MNHRHQIRAAAVRLERYAHQVKNKIWAQNRSELIQALSDSAETAEIARRLWSMIQEQLLSDRT